MEVLFSVIFLFFVVVDDLIEVKLEVGILVFVELVIKVEVSIEVV